MLQRMKTVAEDDCFQDAVDAENDDQEGELARSKSIQPDAQLCGSSPVNTGGLIRRGESIQAWGV